MRFLSRKKSSKAFIDHSEKKLTLSSVLNLSSSTWAKILSLRDSVKDSAWIPNPRNNEGWRKRRISEAKALTSKHEKHRGEIDETNGKKEWTYRKGEYNYSGEGEMNGSGRGSVNRRDDRTARQSEGNPPAETGRNWCRNRLRVVRWSGAMDLVDRLATGHFRSCRSAGKLAMAGIPSVGTARWLSGVPRPHPGHVTCQPGSSSVRPSFCPY